MTKSLLAGTLMLGLASPAFAAQEFFVALDTTANPVSYTHLTLPTTPYV